jgi:hypothetical protein
MPHGSESRWEQWTSWFETAYQDVTRLTFYRFMWRNLVAMLQANKEVEHHSHVNAFLTNSYAQMEAIGIRRQWDRSRPRPTIGRILHEMANQPEVATRASYVELLGPGIAPSGWLSFSPTDAEHIDPVIAANDLQRIHDETRDARDYVNKMVAHLDPRHDQTTGPIVVGSGDWFGDLNKGINVLAEMIKKYWPLFHPGNVLDSVTPIVPPNWIRMFQTAWYSKDFVPVDSGRAADVV